MDIIEVKKMTDSEILSQSIIAGQILISSGINRKIYYDESSISRREITTCCKSFIDYNEIKGAYSSIILNKLYIDLSTLKIYGINMDEFINITTTDQVNTIINNLDSYKVGVAKSSDGKLAAVVTTENQVLTDDGLTFDESVDPNKLLTVVRVKFLYVTIKKDNTKTIYIPFPKENFDFQNGDTMYVVKDSFEFQSKRYTINGSYLVLKDDQRLFMKDEMVTLIFYYKMNYDLNSLVALGTQNIGDGTITTEKLSPYLEISAEHVSETDDRIFFTPEEKDKLKNVEPFATHYVHPATHPAEMIVQSDKRMFITKAILQKLLTTDNGYTKEQVDLMFTHLIGGAPDLLDTLNELSKAINDDANFFTNIMKLINDRALKKDLDTLSKTIDTKVNNNDYVRGCIYGTPDKSSITGVGELYSLPYDDPTLLEYVDGMKVVLNIKDGKGNKTFPYLRINRLLHKKMTTPDGLLLLEGDLSGGGIYEFRYSGSKDSFILQGKGGVNILDTTLNKYQIASGETIIKGQLMDLLPDNTICAKRPHLKMISLNETEQPKFYSNGQVEVVEIDKDSALVLWKWDNSLRAKVINIKDIYADVDNVNYVELSPNCASFTLTKIGSNYIVIYSTIDNILILKHLQVISESTITIVSASQYMKSESSSILQIYAIPIGNDKLFLTWRVGSDTKCAYFDFSSGSLMILSNRNYQNYIFTKISKINDKQIFCSTLSGKTIECWVIIIDANDFSFCDFIENFYTDNMDTLSNLSTVALDDDTIHMNWTNSQSSLYYYMDIDIDINGGLTKGSLHHKEITINNAPSYIIYKQLKIEKGYFLSVSNYNYQIPTVNTAPGKECTKLLISKNGNPFDQIDIFSNIYNLAANYSFTILNNKRVLVVFNSKQSVGDVSHLYFMVCDIIKNPFAVALQSGIGGDTIRVREW